ADLTAVRISADPALRPIPSSDASDVIGKRAAVALVPGTLLTAAELTTEPLPGPGQQLVGLGLQQERLPGRHLQSGAAVLLVIIPAASSLSQPTGATPNLPPQTIPATVVDIQPASKAGTVLVNVAVNGGDGPTVAQMAAADRIAIVLAGS